MAPIVMTPTNEQHMDGAWQLSIWAITITTIVFILALLSTVCVCCPPSRARRKKKSDDAMKTTEQQKQQRKSVAVESDTNSSNSTGGAMSGGDVAKSTQSERSGAGALIDSSTKHSINPADKTLSNLEPPPEFSMSPTVAAVTAAPLTIIALSPPAKVTKKNDAKASSGVPIASPAPALRRGQRPPDAVYYDDPAYRTLGRDCDDPFSVLASRSLNKSRMVDKPKAVAEVKKMIVQPEVKSVAKSVVVSKTPMPVAVLVQPMPKPIQPKMSVRTGPPTPVSSSMSVVT